MLINNFLLHCSAGLCFLVWALGSMGCTADLIIPNGIVLACVDNADCPASAECIATDDGTAKVCVTAGEASCGNSVREAGETCDDGQSNTLKYGIRGRCNTHCDGYAPHCGDGTVNGGESCDAGGDLSDIAPNACRTDCTNPSCGDGVVDSGEVCDDGFNNADNYNDSITCNTACNGYAAYCGDGFINGDEDCDDGNQQDDGNGCSATCSKCTSSEVCPQSGAVSCGDGVVNYLFEECDAGDNNSDFCFHGETSCVKCVPPGYEDANNRENDAPAGCQYRAIAQTWCGDGIVQQEGIRGGISIEAGGENTGQWEACDTGPWIRVDTSVSSLHPYANNSDINYVIEAPAQATAIRVHFSSFETESGWDYVYVGEHAYTGTRTSFLSDVVVGQSLIVRLTSDYYASRNGFDIDYYEYSENYAPSCASLDPSLGSGRAYCRSDCSAYDTSGCSGQDMVLVPAGPFRMGCNAAIDYECGEEESPYHQVYLNSFLIGRTEVTARDYRACVLAGDCTYDGGVGAYTYNNNRGNHPINNVTHAQAKTYCEAQGKRLPTEAEWEKAARGTDGRKYPWGNSPEVSCMHVVMNEGVDGCGSGETWEVGSKPLGVSPYGAHDMIGNVLEWTADWYDEGYYSQTPAEGWINPQGPDNASLHVPRGGSFGSPVKYALRASFRRDPPGNTGDFIGFRCSQ